MLWIWFLDFHREKVRSVLNKDRQIHRYIERLWRARESICPSASKLLSICLRPGDSGTQTWQQLITAPSPLSSPPTLSALGTGLCEIRLELYLYRKDAELIYVLFIGALAWKFYHSPNLQINPDLLKNTWTLFIPTHPASYLHPGSLYLWFYSGGKEGKSACSKAQWWMLFNWRTKVYNLIVGMLSTMRRRTELRTCSAGKSVVWSISDVCQELGNSRWQPV